MGHRRLMNRLFQSNEFREYTPYTELDTSEDFLTYYMKRHPNPELGRNATYIKEKSCLIREAAHKACLGWMDFDGDALSPGISIPLSKVDSLYCLPKEVILHLLSYLEYKDLYSFIKTSRYARSLCYDTFLWKKLCYRTWHDPTLMLTDLSTAASSLTIWYNWNSNNRLSSTQVVDIFRNNIWRLIYITLHILDHVPSVVHSPDSFFLQRSSECFPATRSVRYKSSLGNFKLIGVNQVTRVEYTVFNYIMQPYHRKEYIETMPISIILLRDYGLKTTRSVRGQIHTGFFRRRGYYLKTDENRKVHLSYRYFPTIRFRLYRQCERVFLLCQDIFMNAGETVDCFTMYEIVEDNEQNENGKRADKLDRPLGGDQGQSSSSADHFQETGRTRSGEDNSISSQQQQPCDPHSHEENDVQINFSSSGSEIS